VSNQPFLRLAGEKTERYQTLKYLRESKHWKKANAKREEQRARYASAQMDGEYENRDECLHGDSLHFEGFSAAASVITRDGSNYSDEASYGANEGALDYLDLAPSPPRSLPSPPPTPTPCSLTTTVPNITKHRTQDTVDSASQSSSSSNYSVPTAPSNGVDGYGRFNKQACTMNEQESQENEEDQGKCKGKLRSMLDVDDLED
jgi:hypothetical protein